MGTPANPDIKSAVAKLSRGDQADVARQVVGDMSPGEKEQFAQQVGFPPPSGKVTNQIWLLVMAGFVFVLAGSFVALAVAVFMKTPSDLLLTVFTTTVGFLAGLLAQSPVAGKGAAGGAAT